MIFTDRASGAECLLTSAISGSLSLQGRKAPLSVRRIYLVAPLLFGRGGSTPLVNPNVPEGLAERLIAAAVLLGGLCLDCATFGDVLT